MTFFKWSHTAATNSSADSTINWAEGQAPSSVNDSARAMMAAASKYRDDISGAIATGGTSTAYTVASFQSFDTLAHLDGAMIAFTPHATNGATVTLNVDSLGAKPLRLSPSVELQSGTLIQGTPYIALYNNTDGTFYLHSIAGNPYCVPLGGMIEYTGTTAPNSAFVLPYGQAISRTTYATYFSLVGTTFGVGDGSTTFNVIDKRGRVSAGKDDMGGSAASRITSAATIDGTVLGTAGGAETVTISQANLPAVTLATTIAAGQGSHSHGYKHANTTTGSQGISGANVDGGLTNQTTDAQTLPAMTGTTPLGGSGTAVNKLQPTIIVNYILRII